MPRRIACPKRLNLGRVIPVWVGDLRISRRTADKIRRKHGLTPAEVRRAVVRVADLSYSWENHPTRGLRAIIRTRIRDNEVLVVLYPSRDSQFGDSWNLGSAYRRSE